MIKFQLTIIALVIAILTGCNTAQQAQGDVQVLTASASNSSVTLADRNELAHFQGGSTTGIGGGMAPIRNVDAVQLNDRAELAQFLFESGTTAAYATSDTQNIDLVQINTLQELAEFHTK